MPVPISLLTQSANFIQSNDVIYRTALELIGADVPIYSMGRNKNEKRELLTNLSIFVTFGFLLAPFNAYVLNKLAGKKYKLPNQAFFLLNWKHTDPQAYQASLEHLNQWRDHYHNYLTKPVGMYTFPSVQKRLEKSLVNVDKAISELKRNPRLLDKVYRAKKAVLLVDVLYTSLILGMIGPIRNMVTRVFAHKDRFTGTEGYLSDEDLKKLVVKKEADKRVQKIIGGVLLLSPTVIAALAHVRTRQQLLKSQTPQKVLLKIRDSMDYTGGLYMTLGALFPIALVKNLNLVNSGRDKYEKAETALRYALGMTTFWFGDPLFNGNVVRILDNTWHKKYHTPKGTFYDLDKSGKVLIHSKKVNDVIAYMDKINPSLSKKAGNHASRAFFAGLLAHSMAMAVIIISTLTLTRHRVLRDLANYYASKKGSEQNNNAKHPFKQS